MGNENPIRESSADNPSGSLFGCAASRQLMFAAARIRQPIDDLWRKAMKARRRNKRMITQEGLDWSAAKCREIDEWWPS